MSGRKRTDLVEKVGEMKRMQASWMRERALMMESGGGEEHVEELLPSNSGKSRAKPAGKSTANKSDTLTWTAGGVTKKKPIAKTTVPEKQKALRTRSASPARGGKPSAASGRKTSSRPSSSRSNVSEESRPPSGRTAAVTLLHPEKRSSARDGERDGLKRSEHVHVDGCAGGRRDRHASSGVRDRPRDTLLCNNSDPSLSGLDKDDDILHHGTLASDLEATTSHPSYLEESHPHDGSGVGPREDRLPFSRSVSEQGPKPALDPDAFDQLADKIAGRVKAEMSEEKQRLMHQIGYPARSLLQDEDNHVTDGRIEGHYCCKCKQLMVPPDHTPTMLIPCGHTFCDACSDDRIKCPTCRTRVTSTSLNAALQDVITASSHLPSHAVSQADAEPTPVMPHHHNGRSHGTGEYVPAKYADSGPAHLRRGGDQTVCDESARTRVAGDAEQTRTREISVPGRERDFSGAHRRRVSPEEEARKMVEEYQSLGIRCEALESEEADVLERIEKQNSEISQQKQQMGRIAHKQQELRDEIKSLEARLADLEGHRQEYKRQVADAEDRKREELDQLAMVRTMLRDMQRSRERVKMTARKLDLSLD